MKNIKNRKQRGSVLLTVVSVMSILIVFLFGTMALAVANNNRAHVNYSSAQTGITARAVAESAISAIGNGTAAGQAYADAVGSLSAGDTPISVNVQLKGDNVGTLGHVQDVTISHAGTKMYYDVNKKSWQSRDLLKFTATVTMSGVESTSSVYVLKHKTEDKESSSSGGAGFVTVASADLKCQTNIVGGAYISLPDMDEAKKYVYSNKHIDRTIDRTGRVGVTGEDVTGFGTVVAGDSGATNAFTLDNGGAIIEADLFVNNNMYVQNWSGFVFPGPEKGITVWGDLVFNENAIDHLYYEYLGDKKSDFSFTEVPYIYVDGNISGRSGVVKLGNGNQQGDTLQDFPLNIFCGTINCGDINNNGGMGKSSVIAGNLYCMDEDGNSSIKANNIRNQLFNWSESVVKKIKDEGTTTYVGGEICSNGNLTLGAMTDDLNVYGDVRVRGNLKIEVGSGKKVKVHGNVVVGGKIDGIENIEIVQVSESEGDEQIYVDMPSKGADAKTFDIPREVGYYYVHTPVLTNDGWVGPEGKLLNDGNVFVEGEYQYIYGAAVEDEYVPENADEIKIYYTLKQVKNTDTNEMRSVRQTDTEEDFVNGNYEGLPEDYSVESLIDYDIPYLYAWGDFMQEQLSEEFAATNVLKQAGLGGRPESDNNDLKGFYIDTDVVSESFKEIESADAAESGFRVIEQDGKYYQYKVTTHYSKEKGATFKYTLPGTGGVEYKHPNDFLALVNEPEGEIYPKYAERLIILGKEASKADGTIEDGKIVKTMEEVLDKVANPYKDYMDADGNEKKPDNVTKLWSKASGTVYTADTIPQADGKYTINESCTLDFAANTNIQKELVITPESNGLLVIVKNFKMEAGCHIIIDDSASTGDVYFYVDNGGTFEHRGNAGIMTMTYYNALYNDNKKNLTYNYEADAYYDIADKNDISDGSPNVYFYGGKNSNMLCGNMGIITANIISPYMKLSISGGTGSPVESFLYDGYDIVQGRYHSYDGDSTDFPEVQDVKNLVIGCVNVSAADIPNQFCSIYIPSAPTKEGGGDIEEGEWWYKVLYYNEF